MKTRIVDGIEVQRSSGNVYADLDLPDADKLRIKTGLVIEIRHAMRRLGLTQQAAAKRMSITQGLRHDARELHESVRAQADGLSEPAGVRHRNQGETRRSPGWALENCSGSEAVISTLHWSVPTQQAPGPRLGTLRL